MCTSEYVVDSTEVWCVCPTVSRACEVGKISFDVTVEACEVADPSCHHVCEVCVSTGYVIDSLGLIGELNCSPSYGCGAPAVTSLRNPLSVTPIG